VYLADPSVSRGNPARDRLRIAVAIARDAGRLQVMHALNTYLLERTASSARWWYSWKVQACRSDLEEIRLLSNLETQQHKLLQIVLFGSPNSMKTCASRKYGSCASASPTASPCSRSTKTTSRPI